MSHCWQPACRHVYITLTTVTFFNADTMADWVQRLFLGQTQKLRGSVSTLSHVVIVEVNLR